ncbi:hypothetical protein NONO_c60960 [Nocardia nova SH22a]|uniref:Uncharacterized protein n=1 Tax=Nocardia nova SH22a TaxID=1415166 RepID=W5TNQ6_9NOCA|nr:hypothetical protein [Nocardia nova]AHH20872.1 hypothetical protein NONO_c60960 [Nocardia nova SH22a]
MATATVHIDDVQGFPGPARCFKVDPPYHGADFVVVWAQPSFGRHQEPEAGLVPATETGACAERSVKKRGGSYVLHDEPDTQERIDGAHWLALIMAGYTLTEAS